MYAAENVADLESDSRFVSAFRKKEEDIPHTRNNWVCYDFKKRRIVPFVYTNGINDGGHGGAHLKSWLVETSADWKNWRTVVREEDDNQLNGSLFMGTFEVAVPCGEKCHFMRLVNIGRNHFGNGQVRMSAWEIFGILAE
jgi:hypothetical protein